MYMLCLNELASAAKLKPCTAFRWNTDSDSYITAFKKQDLSTQ